MKFSKFTTTLLACFLISQSADAEIPNGYYSACEGKTGKALLEALNATISKHDVVSYSGLWTLYHTSDIDENGKIWDMYSTKRWTYSSEQCGSYSSIGDCYNREHSFPKSWFNDASPMVSDAFHIYPTDGKVNGQRSNYPYGECKNGTYAASSGSVKALGRLGASTFEGYSGVVFEPDDMYKGDFARSYFYMAACYNERIASWSSPMLDGSSYPAFSDWAKRLLLNWTRSDEVSQKEINRNEAVYAAQHNRNPFIDHPELAEYIWGNKVGQPWSSTGAVTPEFVLPLADQTINLGYAAVGVPRSVDVTVKGSNLTSAVAIFVSGLGYSVTPTSITAQQANAGYTITITQRSNYEGDAEGTLTLSSGSLRAYYDLTCSIEEGLPLLEASNITDHSFTASWIYLNDYTSYTLHVRQGSQYVAGYPRNVDAAAQSYEVTGLDPETTYTVWISSAAHTSSSRNVTTGASVPSISLIYSGLLSIETTAGIPSDIIEIGVEANNISSDIIVAVNAPFQVSTDRINWSTTTSLGLDEDRFYLRLYSNAPGDYRSAITLDAGNYVYDDTDVEGVVTPAQSSSGDFYEDFEECTIPAAYQTQTFTGHYAEWSLVNGGSGNLTQDRNFNSTTALRFNKATATAESSLTLNEDKYGGMGTVSFQSARWNNNNDKTVKLDIDYSSDHGSTWTTIGTIDISDTDAATYTLDINREGTGRIRFKAQDGSGRWFLDNISITDYNATAINTIDHRSWDAYGLGGNLIIESPDQPTEILVFGADGITYVPRTLVDSRTVFTLHSGLYIVSDSNNAVRVLIK